MKTTGCDSLVVLASAYVDGELVGGELEAFEAHLGECGRCRAAVDEEHALLDLMRAAGPLHRAPAGLRAAVGHALAAAAPPRRWLPLVAAGLVAGLVAAVAGALWTRGPVPRPALSSAGSSEFASLAVDTHLRHVRGQLPLEVRSERPQEVTGWFGGRVPFHLELPDYPVGLGQRKPYTLIGARLVSFHGDYAAYVVYRMEDRPISLLVTSSTAVHPQGGTTVNAGALVFHLEAVAGLKVITWMDRGLTYALVSDLPEDGAQSCLVCHGTEQERRKLDGLRRRAPVS
jgi:anti-sigma factor RsiW